MSRSFRLSRTMILAACLISGVTAPAFASDLPDLVGSATNAYNDGIAAEEDHRYAEACESYHQAADLWESAIYSLMGLPMDTEDDRESIKAYAADLQGNIDSAKENAAAVCGKS